MRTDVGAVTGGVWVTCAELANRKRVSRQAVTKRVEQLEREGKIATRREGRSRLVELAEYDRAIGEVGNAIREAAVATVREQRSPAPAMRDAQTERARYEAKLKALDLAERQRNILPISGENGIEAAATVAGLALARELDGLMRYADEIAIAVSKEGVAGARRVLKDASVKIRVSAAEALSQIAQTGAAAEQSGPLETEFPDE